MSNVKLHLLLKKYADETTLPLQNEYQNTKLFGE